MNFEPTSYQDPKLVPPDEPDVLVDGDGNEILCRVSHCNDFAIDLENSDESLPMCEEHHRYAAEEAEAERQLTMREEAEFHDCPNCGGHNKEGIPWT